MKSLPYFLAKPNPRYLLDNPFVVLDFETTNIEKGDPQEYDNRVVLACWYVSSDNSRHSLFLSRDGLDSLIHYLSDNPDVVIVSHNSKFELQWLVRYGYKLGSNMIYDTMLGEFVIAGNRKFDLTLEATAKRYGLEGKEHVVSLMIKGGICPSTIPKRWLTEYCLNDIELTLQVFLAQRKKLEQDQLLQVMYTRCLTCIVLADIELKGMCLDPIKVKKEYDDVKREEERLLSTLHNLSGGINWNSPKQVGAWLYDTLGFDELRDKNGEPDRTDAGGRRTDQDAIVLLEARTNAQQQFLEVYKEYIPLKAAVQSLTKMMACVKDNTVPIIKAKFNQTVAQTHRLSSSGKKYKLQFQNFDRDYKHLFTARVLGHLMGEVDGAQLEFRAAGDLTGDERIYSDIVNKEDIHRFTGSVILGKPEPQVTSKERTDAKKHTFKPLFGGMSGTKAQKAYYQAFRDKYSTCFKVQTGWTHEVLVNKKLRLASGLIFYWPDTKMSSTGYISNTSTIFNYPIQSFATAEIIPIAMVYFWFKIKMQGLTMLIVNTVHDSVVVELPPNEVDAFATLARECFIDDVYSYLEAVYNYKMHVPLGMEAKIGTHWGTGKELIAA